LYRQLGWWRDSLGRGAAARSGPLRTGSVRGDRGPRMRVVKVGVARTARWGCGQGRLRQGLQGSSRSRVIRIRRSSRGRLLPEGLG